MATLKFLLLSLIIFSRFSLSSPFSPETFLDASDTLSESGYVAMALTLELISQTLTIQFRSPSATVFSPPDSAFSLSGQPSLSLLQFHFSPLAFSSQSLRSLPLGTKVPTMSPGLSLIVTTSDFDEQISLNNVKITKSPIYTNGSLIIYGIDDFFDPNFNALSPIQSPNRDYDCVVSGYRFFGEASERLRSTGYSTIASFLDLQLPRFDHNNMMLTVFAPVDEAIRGQIGSFTDYPSLFLRHVLPCKLSWTDLVNLRNGTVLQTSMEGFSVKITQSGGRLLLNEVEITYIDVYYNDWLIIHGLPKMLTLPKSSDHEDRSNNAPSLSALDRIKLLFSYLFLSL